MKVLNLGCGTKVSSHPDVTNIDWSIYLRLRKNPVLRHVTPLVVSGERRKRFLALPDNILVHDLARGIPFPDRSVDAVYHSHTLEHLDRQSARGFLKEVLRVLKPGGIHRIVVPDLERLCRAYVNHIDACDSGTASAADHDEYVAAFLEQCVRREATGTSQQPPFRRFVENVVLGDATRQGDAHQWMYDRLNLAAALGGGGYQDIRVESYRSSRIPNWAQYGLDVNDQGGEYKPESIYIEASRPAH
jgi:SAM-dependent methyltransferase